MKQLFKYTKKLEQEFILENAIQDGIAIFCNMLCRHVKHCFVVQNGRVVHAVLNTFTARHANTLITPSWLGEAFGCFQLKCDPS
jgi:hypothetical protein